MPDTSSLGLAAAKAKTAEQVQREEILGRLMKPLPPEDKVTAPQSTGPTVTVACKVPMGLCLRIFEMVDDTEPLFGGGHKKIKRAQQVAEPVVLRGPGHMWRNPNLPQEEMDSLQPAGYALTHGVSREFWERWYDQNKQSPLVLNGLVYAGSDDHDVRAQAKDGQSYYSGLEPLDPTSPSRFIGDIDRRLTIQPGERPSGYLGR